MASHTNSGEWQSFEARMRQRRAARLALRAEAAADAGCEEEARACLDEARGLVPSLAAYEGVEEKLRGPSQPVASALTGLRAGEDSRWVGGSRTVVIAAADAGYAEEARAYLDEARGLPSLPAYESVEETVRDASQPVASALPGLHAGDGSGKAGVWRKLVTAAAAILVILTTAARVDGPDPIKTERDFHGGSTPVTAADLTGSASVSSPLQADPVEGQATDATHDERAPATRAAEKPEPASTPPPAPIAQPQRPVASAFAAPSAGEGTRKFEIPSPGPSPRAVSTLGLGAVTPAEPPAPSAERATTGTTAAAPAPTPIAALPEPAVEIAAPAAPPPAAAPPAAELSQEPLVRRTLNQYAAAYSALDANAASRVWPRVDRGALSRAFGTLASQQVSLGDCRVDVTGARARAVCSGSATWAPKIGSGSARTDARRWDFELAKTAGGWEIVNARVQKR
jgi:hypothetical protein